MSKLSQIQEGKASRYPRSRESSVVSPTTEPKARRRRHTEGDALNRPRIRHKHGSLQRHAESLARLSNPSLVSVLSDLTQQSSASGGSNSTITQKSYDDQSLVADREMPQEKGLRSGQTSKTSTPVEMDAAPTDVFQFLNEGSQSERFTTEDTHSIPPSTNASSPSSSVAETQLDDDVSSNEEDPRHDTESPMTSPASARVSNPAGPRLYGRRNPAIPLYASSFVHGHEGSEEDDDDEEEEEDEQEEGSETDSDEEEHESQVDATHSNHASTTAMEKVPPPRAPSTSSRHSDPHTRRLRQQERELANHVLQSPQPHKDFQFGGAPPANGYPSMPLYSPRAYSGASPANMNPTSEAWPPMPPFPAPLPIGYANQGAHLSPETGHAFPLSVRPPMGAPESMVQQMAPPFHQHAVQPPLHPPHAPGPDLSRTTVVGYELLADKLSEPSKGDNKRLQVGVIVPMYRRFEHLNHRVLLHLQDEICELEEELRYLDECIAQTSPRDEAGHAYPASRRGDARYGGELHYRRTELLGRIFQKLGQYSK